MSFFFWRKARDPSFKTKILDIEYFEHMNDEQRKSYLRTSVELLP